MTPSPFLRNLRRNWFPTPTEVLDDARRDFTVVISPPPPEPSCFARGVALSIEREPESWEPISERGYSLSYDLKVEHMGVRLYADGRWPRSNSPLLGCQRLYVLRLDGTPDGFTETDHLHIARALDQHPLGTLKVKRDEWLVEEAKRREAEAHFTRLGCPSPSPIPPSTLGSTTSGPSLAPCARWQAQPPSCTA